MKLDVNGLAKLIILALILIILVSYFYFLINETKKEQKQVCFETKCFNIKIADTQIERIDGLMNQEILGEDEGMLFVFDEEGTYGFWMKNMKFPIDIVWIDKNLTVVETTKNISPCTEEPCKSYYSKSPILYVLELNAGKIEEFDIVNGMKVTLSYQ